MRLKGSAPECPSPGNTGGPPSSSCGRIRIWGRLDFFIYFLINLKNTYLRCHLYIMEIKRINPVYQLEVKSPERSFLSNLSTSHLHFLSPTKPRDVCVSNILTSAELSDGSWKRETSIQSSQNEEAQTEGETTIRHRGRQSALRRRSITASYYVPLIQWCPRRRGENIYSQDQIRFYLGFIRVCTAGCAPVSTLQRIKSQTAISFIYFSRCTTHERSPEVNSWLRLTVVRFLPINPLVEENQTTVLIINYQFYSYFRGKCETAAGSSF